MPGGRGISEKEKKEKSDVARAAIALVHRATVKEKEGRGKTTPLRAVSRLWKGTKRAGKGIWA